MAVRRRLHAAGLRYRVNVRPEPTLRRTADIVFSRAKVVVFIDGCFWHSCPRHATHPATNHEFWADKLARTAARDRDTTRRLTDAGWTVLRFWEHEAPDDVAATIAAAIARGRPPT